MADGSGLRAGAALQGFDDGWADVDLVEPFDALHPARALGVDLRPSTPDDPLAAIHAYPAETKTADHAEPVDIPWPPTHHQPSRESDPPTTRPITRFGPRILRQPASFENGYEYTPRTAWRRGPAIALAEDFTLPVDAVPGVRAIRTCGIAVSLEERPLSTVKVDGVPGIAGQPAWQSRPNPGAVWPGG
jgi:hypothetical protein